MYTNHKRRKNLEVKKQKNLLYINQLYIYLLQKKNICETKKKQQEKKIKY